MNLSNSTLYIVSTPIGNLEDITLRAIKVLEKADIILCEDTRHSLKLLNHFNIKKKLIPYHKFNERKQIREIIKYLNQGKILALISDAGTPLLSDPGRVLLNECLNKNIQVVPIPGVSAITTSMSISGFKDQFLFYGFLPKKDGELDKALEILSHCKYSQIFFIPAVKINFYFKKFAEYFHGRKFLIAKELTKIHEAFHRGEINNLKLFKISLKGELTVVISEGNIESKKLDQNKIINRAKKLLKKYSLKDTVDLIVETEKQNKKKVYQLCLKIKNEKNI